MYPVSLSDIEKLAKQKLPKQTWDYYRNGATNEQTLKDNCDAFKRYRLRPKVLVNVSNVDLSTFVLGAKLDIPICVSATAMNRLADPLGEISTAKATASAGSGYVLSSISTTSIEEVSKAAPNLTKWFQVYMFKDRQFTKELVQRAEQNGYQGIFLTVDSPVIGLRYRDARNKFTLPPHLRLPNLDRMAGFVKRTKKEKFGNLFIDSTQKWSDVKWLKSITKLPIVLKGIITAEMAELAVCSGVDGILVSNHGARQLDGVFATIDALPEVVQAVRGRCEVYLDGGVRSGTDVLKAIALGARAVFIGRPAIWGLAYKGEEGVKEVLHILQNEFKNALQLTGCTSIADLQKGKNLVVPQNYLKSLLV